MVRNRNKVFLLPEPERFLYNISTKFLNLTKDNILLEDVYKIDLKDYKKWLKDNVLPKKFNIKTKLVTIKRSKRA
jgi:hypothetical protein